jgi:hypothetical protein
MFFNESAEKTRTITMKFKNPTILDRVGDKILRKLPELSGDFEIRHSIARYKPMPELVTLYNSKFSMSVFEIMQITSKEYAVTVTYNTPILRPGLAALTGIGTCFGLLPGAIIYLIGRETETVEVGKVAPLLVRMESILEEICNEKVKE